MYLKTHLTIMLMLAMTFSKSYPVSAQLDIWSNLKQLQLGFSERDSIRIGQIEHQKENARGLIEKAIEEEDNEYIKRAFNELFTASRELFDLYDHYCITERQKLSGIAPSEIDRPVRLERRAQAKISKSEIIRSEAEDINESPRLAQMCLVAYDLEQLALLNKGRALRMYQDFPAVYSYQWDSDFTSMEGTPTGIIRYVNTVEKSHEGQEEEILQWDDHTNQPGEGITYIIQIAAHTNEIPGDALRDIYQGDRAVKMMVENNWYKYYLGPFDTFKEAGSVMSSLGLNNVFVAAYLNGQRISVGEARKKQSEGR
jgi:hypothetical protein